MTRVPGRSTLTAAERAAQKSLITKHRDGAEVLLLENLAESPGCALRRPGATTSPIGCVHMAVQRMDNVGIVVEDLEAAIEFFRALGLELEGQALVEGEWAGAVTGLGDQRVEVAMMRTPDSHSRLELSRFLSPPVIADHRTAPVNALGYLRVMFAVDDLDDTLSRLRALGAVLVSSEVVQYADIYRLCYIRGPEGILIGLAQELR